MLTSQVNLSGAPRRGALLLHSSSSFFPPGQAQFARPTTNTAAAPAPPACGAARRAHWGCAFLFLSLPFVPSFPFFRELYSFLLFLRSARARGAWPSTEASGCGRAKSPSGSASASSCRAPSPSLCLNYFTKERKTGFSKPLRFYLAFRRFSCVERLDSRHQARQH